MKPGRRVILIRAAAVATSAAIAPLATTRSLAADADAMPLFIRMSVALTGLPEGKLNPKRNTLRVNVTLLDRASADASFTQLLKICRDNPQLSGDALAKAIFAQADERGSRLARSIMLSWYLGAWYQPDSLKEAPFLPYEVPSSDAYTQAWAWRVAQAHPMGYSEFFYGYWNGDPIPLADYFKVTVT